MKPLETFYDECVRVKIAQCELKSLRGNGRSYCTKLQYELKRAQATFFEDNKEDLIQEMINYKENIGRNLSRINSFLNNAFFASFPARVYWLVPGETPDVSEGLQDDMGCIPWDEAAKLKMREPVCTVDGYCLHPERFAHSFEYPWSDGALIADEDDE